MMLVNLSNKDYTFEVGEKCVQFKVEKVYDTELSFVEETDQNTTRGEGGFGSSGRF